MLTRFRWLTWVCAIILIANFGVLRLYGDTLRSTNLFIVRSTVFYPLAWLNLVAGISLIVVVIWEQSHKENK